MLTRCVIRSEPKFLAVFPNLNARCFSVRTRLPGNSSQSKCEAVFSRTRIPGNFPQFKREASLGQNQISWRNFPVVMRGIFFFQGRNPWRYFLVLMRGVIRSEPKFQTVFPSLNARSFSVRTETPESVSQLGREAFFGQNHNSWRFLPV